MITSFKFGSNILPLELPDTTTLLKTHEPTFNISKKTFQKKLESLIKNKPLNKIAIVVADKTRSCDYSIYLP